MSVNISIRDAVKKYGDNTVISGLSLNIKDPCSSLCST